VRRRTVKNRGSIRWEPTRRELLGAAAAMTFGVLPGLTTAYGQSSQPTTSAADPRGQDPRAWWLRREPARARVVDVRGHDVLHAAAADPIALGEMLDQGIQNLTGVRNVSAAWRTVLGSVERIVVKFNSVGAQVLRTSEGLARLLVQRLTAAGYESAKLMLVEIPGFVAEELGTGPVPRGWGSEIEVGGSNWRNTCSKPRRSSTCRS
jgi:hypothetical protein